MGKYHLEGEIITSEQTGDMLFAALFNHNAHAARACEVIFKFVFDMENRKRGDGFLCATCEHEFAPDNPPRAMAVLYPMFGTQVHVVKAIEKLKNVRGDKGHADAVVTGICARCYDTKVTPDPVAYLLDHSRKIMPDATYVAPLNRQ